MIRTIRIFIAPLMVVILSGISLSLSAQAEEKMPRFNAGGGLIIANSSDFWDDFMKGPMCFGANFQINKIIGKKILLGISTDIGVLTKGSYSEQIFFGLTVDYSGTSGSCISIFIPVTAYMAGDAVKSAAGFYTRVGIGVVWRKTNYTVSESSTKITDDVSTNSTSLAMTGSLGVDFKIGSGRLYFELNCNPSLTGNVKVVEQIGTTSTSESYDKNIVDHFLGETAVRIGYIFTF